MANKKNSMQPHKISTYSCTLLEVQRLMSTDLSLSMTTLVTDAFCLNLK